jgi:hypothetical protein
MYSVTPSFNFKDEDMVDIISAAIYDINYWAVIDNTTDDWKRVSESLPKNHTFEDVMWTLLKTGGVIYLEDAENDDEIYELTLNNLLNGIKLTIEQKYWDGDIDTIDGEIGDIIFQMALFDQIVFG